MINIKDTDARRSPRSLTRRLRKGMVLSALALFLGLAEGARAQTMTEFPVPTADTGPTDITTGPDGNLWFTELSGNRIGRITPAGVDHRVRRADRGQRPDGHHSGPRRQPLVHRVGRRHQIGRITPAGAITEFPRHPPRAATRRASRPAPTATSGSPSIGGNRIGRITPAGAITEFTRPHGPERPVGITAGPDGNLWFTESDGQPDRPDHARRASSPSFQPAPAGSGPAGITAGPDGNLWFTEMHGNRIGRITPAGVVTEFSRSPPPGSDPPGITAGPDGNLWFTETTATGSAGSPRPASSPSFPSRQPAAARKASPPAPTATSGSRNSTPTRSAGSPRVGE